MDAFELKRRFDAAREFDLPHEGITLRLRVWSEPQFLDLIGGLSREELTSFPKLVARMVPPAVVGWSGVREAHLVPDGSAEAVQFSRELVEAVLTAFPTIAFEAYRELDARFYERRTRAQAERKN